MAFFDCPICSAPFSAKPSERLRGRRRWYCRTCSKIINLTRKMVMPSQQAPLCACGCGERVGRYRAKHWRYRKNHHLKELHAAISGPANWLYSDVHKVGNYFYVRQPDHIHANRRGFVKRSWLVIESIVGRPVERGAEEVHHINRDPTDDRPENLQLLTKAEHCRVHKEDHETGRRRCLALRAALIGPAVH